MILIEGLSVALSSPRSAPSEAGSEADLPAVAQADLTALVETYSPLLFRVAHSVLRSPAEAEDVVQDTFLRVLRHHRTLPAVRDLRVWLVRIAWNLALDCRRRIQPDQIDASFAHRLIAATIPADQALHDAQRMTGVLRELDRLPKAERQVLLLSALDELSTPELAAITGLRDTQPSPGMNGRIFHAIQLQASESQAISPPKASRLACILRRPWPTAAALIDATPEQIALAERIVHDLDRPGKTYRLTYTLTDLDNGQRVGTEHYSMIVVTGQPTSLKQGEKVPVATGTYSPSSSAAEGTQTQFTYLDVGMNFSATLYESANSVRLESKVEQSSIAEHATIVGVQEPIVRQTVLQGASFLEPGKPLILGSLDIAGTTRRMEISVVMDQVK